MNVLSLFDGMSCGQQALQKANIQVTNYYASEIDKYAIQITQKNYPNTIQIGSVIDVRAEELPQIDLLIGGSPCQNLSFAGSRKGLTTKENIEILTLEHYLELKADGFKFEGQSYLFWEYMRLLKETKPKYFLLENVVMGKKWQKVFSDAIGCEPIMINSSLVSAQTRRRLYWTNIPNITQPQDKGIYLKDILEDEVDAKYFLSDKVTERYKDLDSKSYVGTTAPAFRTIGQRDVVYGEHNKMGCLVATDYKQPKQILIQGCDFRKDEGIRVREGGKTGTLCARARTDESCGQLAIISQVERLLERTQVDVSNVTEPTIMDVYNKKLVKDGKCNTLTLPHHNAQRLIVPPQIRKLTPIECERLQTVNDNYTEGVSDSQRYKMLGNGWTISVISHIFSHIN
jgi:site-specific DNA-cytosine methylase